MVTWQPLLFLCLVTWMWPLNWTSCYGNYCIISYLTTVTLSTLQIAMEATCKSSSLQCITCELKCKHVFTDSFLSIPYRYNTITTRFWTRLYPCMVFGTFYVLGSSVSNSSRDCLSVCVQNGSLFRVYSVLLWPKPYGPWSKVVHYIGKMVPFSMQRLSVFLFPQVSVSWVSLKQHSCSNS